MSKPYIVRDSAFALSSSLLKMDPSLHKYKIIFYMGYSLMTWAGAGKDVDDFMNDFFQKRLNGFPNKAKLTIGELYEQCGSGVSYHEKHFSVKKYNRILARLS